MNDTARAAAARVAHCARSIDGERCTEHFAAFILITWGHDDHIGNAGQVGKVKGAIVCGPIGTDQPATVNRKNHGQVLQGNVMDQLVVGTLKECGVNRDDGLHAFAGEPRRECQRMLFGNADVKIPIRKFLGKAQQP